MVSANGRMTLFLPGIGHAPDLLSAVVDDQQGSITDHRDANGSAPDAFTGFIGNPSHQEVLVAAFRFSVCEWDANDFVAAAFRAIPRPMESDKGVALVFFREHFAGIKDDAERRRVRFDQDVWNDRSRDQFL